MAKRPPLQPQQSRFVFMIAILIIYAWFKGYRLTFGDAWAKDGHKKRSLHYIRLAVDFNLFIDNVWQENTEAHRPLGEFWELMGGIWGGRHDDGNHYALKRLE